MSRKEANEWGGEKDIFAFLEAELCSHSHILTAQTAAGSLSSWGVGGVMNLLRYLDSIADCIKEKRVFSEGVCNIFMVSYLVSTFP